jgi:hypothetical protein
MSKGEKMLNSTEKILNEIDERKKRIAGMTAGDFKKAYDSLAKKGFPVAETSDFIYDIGHSAQIEYHYEILRADWKKGNDHSELDGWFEAHDEEGIAYLLTRLQNNEDSGCHGHIIYLLAKVLDKLTHRPFYATYKTQAVPLAEKLAFSEHAEIRRKSIIALGWIGGEKQVPALGEIMLNDKDSKCRAWAASSCMQMWFRIPTKSLADKIKPCLLRGIRQEQDYFTLGTMIEAVQTVEKKRWLAQKAVESVDTQAIASAKQKALRYLEK